MTTPKLAPPAHQHLADFLKEVAGVDPRHVFLVLETLEVHSSLSGLSRVAQHARSVISRLPQIDAEEWSDESRQSMALVLKACVDHADSFQRLHPDIDYAGRSVPKKRLGFIVEYPLYASLWYPAPVYLERIYRDLQACFIHACSRFRRIRESDVEANYEPVKSLMGKLIRALGTGDDRGPWLEGVESEFQRAMEDDSPMDALHSVAQLQLDSQQEGDTPWAVIERLLAFALDKRGGHSGSKGGYRGAIRESEPAFEEDNPARSSKPAALKVFRTTRVSRREAQDAYRDGCAPDEIYCSSELITSSEPLKAERGESSISRIVLAHEQYRYISTANQLLPYRWDRLNLQDILALIGGLVDRHKEASAEAQELVAFVSTMYWTSSSPERAAGCRLVRTIQDLPKQISASDLYYALAEKCWVTGVLDLKQRKRASAHWAGYLRATENRVVMPADPAASRLMRSWLERRQTIAGKRPEPVFLSESELLDQRSATLFSELNKQKNSRLTQVRVQNHVFSLVVDRSKDLADACLLFGRLPPAGLVTALYYYCPKASYLRDVYSATAREIVATVRRARGNPKPQTRAIEKVAAEWYVGSEICPTDEFVARLVADLQNRVETTRCGKRDRYYIAEFHNAFTAYTIMMLAFATGYRAVRDPFSSLTDIDSESEFLAISDKDGDDYFNSRVVWVPEVCQKQIAAYQNHRRALAEHLILLTPDVARSLLASDDDFAWPGARNQTARQAPFLFFLGKDWQVKPVSPKTLAPEVGWCYELPLNANRHFLRTRLREAGVSGEIVDVFMGHWERGQEQHNRYSTLSPLAYKAALSGALTALMESAGWRSIVGLGRG